MGFVCMYRVSKVVFTGGSGHGSGKVGDLYSLPAFIITDGDDIMHAAIASIPYSDVIHHLLCTFHLFDFNEKKKKMPFLQATGSGNGSQRALFR